CGNNICEESTGESFGACPGDCLPKNIEFDILEPNVEETFFRGEPVLFKVKITGDSKNLLSAKTTAKGQFGEVKLFNDGRHNDGNTTDAIYANTFFIGNETESGVYTISLDVDFRGVLKAEDVNAVIDPKLDLELDVKEKFPLGKNVEIAGQVKKKGYTFEIPINVKLSDGRSTVFDFNTTSDSNGMFYAEYRSSLIDREGTWLISVQGFDSNNNEVFAEKGIQLIEPGKIEFLVVDVLTESGEEFKSGSDVPIIVAITDESDQTIENAIVSVVDEKGRELILLELTLGEYSGAYKIPFDMGLGTHILTVRATDGDGAGVSGLGTFEFAVIGTEIILEIIEPSKKVYAVGDALNPSVFLSYKGGDRVPNANVKVLLNNKEISLNEFKTSVFSSEYVLQEDDIGRIKILFNATDNVGNEGSAETFAEVSGTSPWQVIQDNLVIIVAVIVVLAIVGIAVATLLPKKAKHKSLLKRRKQLKALNLQIQDDYFKKASISEEEYTKLSKDYESELEEIEKKLGAHAK
ncbi:MAG: hypothetical protein QGI60_05195, partial [archaeon]|nr:hypothetical protein [archaeon]